MIGCCPPDSSSAIESVIVNPVLLFSDPLTSADKIPGQASQRVTGGEFTAQGWKATENKNQLMIELAGDDGFDGALEIDLIDLDGVKANTRHNQDKIAFLSMFSNASGCPHASHGGSNLDCAVDAAVWPPARWDDIISVPANGAFFDLGTSVPVRFAPRVEGTTFRRSSSSKVRRKLAKTRPIRMGFRGSLIALDSTNSRFPRPI